MTTDELILRHSALVHELHAANSHYHVLEAILDEKDADRRWYQQFFTFFAMAVSAHFDALMFGLFRLTDKTKRAVSVESFLQLAKKYPHLFPFASADEIKNSILNDRRELASVAKELKGLRDRRNKTGAHLDKDFLSGSGKRIEDVSPFSYSDMERLVQVLERILLKYRRFLIDKPGEKLSASGQFYRAETDAFLEYVAENFDRRIA